MFNLNLSPNSCILFGYIVHPICIYYILSQQGSFQMKFYKALALAATLSLLSSQVLADANGGKTCAGCTIVMALVTQLVQVHEITVISGIEQLCGLLPFLQSVACTTFFETYGEQLIDMIEKNYTPDVICNTIEYCNNKTNPTCHLIGSNGGRMSQREFEHHVAEVE